MTAGPITLHEPSTEPLIGAAVSVGGVSLAVNGISHAQLGKGMAAFLSDGRKCDIDVFTDWSSEINPLNRKPTFCSGALWTLFRQGDDFIFDCESPLFGTTPYKRMRVNRGFTCAHITLHREMLARYAPVSPLEYPTDELLVTNHLACHGLGAEVHGCGLVDARAGAQLFLGHSGTGKSTTTRLWETFADPEILSDDRIILRLHKGELWMYGTPWHGEAEFASASRAKLSRIFILQQGKKNVIRPLSPAQSIGEVFARCFPPFHSAIGLERTLEFLSRALAIVPCYEFEFVPDRSAVETVRKFHD